MILLIQTPITENYKVSQRKSVQFNKHENYSKTKYKLFKIAKISLELDSARSW